MWTVVKYKKGELKTLKNSLLNNLGKDIFFFTPKIKYKIYKKNKFQTFEKNVLEGYLILYHENITSEKISENLKYMRGLSYFLPGFIHNQKELIDFVNYCNTFQDKDGYLKQEFFNITHAKNIKFISGPFTNFMFEIISKQKDQVNFLLGNIKVLVNKKTKYLYCRA